MMKLWRKIATSILAAALLMNLLAASVMAAEPYSYTVTFYAGNQGAFTGAGGLTVNSDTAVITQDGSKIVVSGLQAGDEVGLNAQAAVALDSSSKYYVQGLRLSGRDNDTVEASVFVVDGDADYVVAYGIKGNQVAYTVNYRDDDGNDLAPSEVFYGNVGDKPVVSYMYIEGYVPEALGLTKTLSANAAENVFTFEYDPVPAVVVTPPTTDDDADQDEGTVPGGEGEDADESSETSEPTGEEESDQQQEGFEESEAAGSEEEESEIIVDLDEESIPLAPGEEDGAEDETDGTLTTYIAVGVISAVVLIAAVVVAIVIK
ncbi:MAG: hypothetical protein IKL38_06110, partial [Firmicutes bacterium]|nr:hypothetical protein [Bacillota bacterium]